MRILAAFDKCKDSLNAWEICSIVKSTILSENISQDVTIAPLTDGGEGFVELLTRSQKGDFHNFQAKDALGQVKEVKIGLVSALNLSPYIFDFMNLSNCENLAIVEMSSVVGLSDLDQTQRNPWNTSTFGVGELLEEAKRLGADSILLGIGGSSTNDLGVGAMSALKIKFSNCDGELVSFPSPQKWSSIQNISSADKIALPPIRIACDVNNPLLGENGATFQFGPQKGLDLSRLDEMEKNLSNMSEKLSHVFGKSLDSREEAGSGAAGGIGYGLGLAYDAEFLPGFALVEKWLDLENRIKNADFVITGEGRFDRTSLCGKGPYEVIRMASKYGKKLLVLAGSVEEEAATFCKSEFSNLEIHAFGKEKLTLEENLTRAPEFLKDKIKEVFQESGE